MNQLLSVDEFFFAKCIKHTTDKKTLQYVDKTKKMK